MEEQSYIRDLTERSNVERREEWNKWRETLPYIQFPADWSVQIIPPSNGAQVRFRVKLPSGKTKSIYFDAYGKLGCYGWPEPKPYWEVYPYHGDVGRCDMLDTAKLLQMIGNEDGS